MSERCYSGGIFDDNEILWFILIFLILFYCRPFFGGPVANVGC